MNFFFSFSISFYTLKENKNSILKKGLVLQKKIIKIRLKDNIYIRKSTFNYNVTSDCTQYEERKYTMKCFSIFIKDIIFLFTLERFVQQLNDTMTLSRQYLQPYCCKIYMGLLRVFFELYSFRHITINNGLIRLFFIVPLVS